MMNIISQARGVKTNNNVSLKTPIKNLTIGAGNSLKEAINESSKDFKATLFIENLNIKDIKNDYEIYDVELNLESIE